jgi:hypothetical protein
MKRKKPNSYYENLIKDIAEKEGFSFNKDSYLCWSCVYKDICNKVVCIFSAEATASYNE